MSKRDPGRVAGRAGVVPRAVRAPARARVPLGGVRGVRGGARPSGHGPPGRRLEHPVRARLHVGVRRPRRRRLAARRAVVPRPVPARAGVRLRPRRVRPRVHGAPAVAGAPRRRRARAGSAVTRLAGAARRCLRGVRGSVHRSRARGDPRPRRLLRDSTRGRGAARRLLARAGDPVRARRRRVHADDGRVPLAARPLSRDPVRRGRGDGRARPAALLREVLRAPDLREPRRSSGSASSRSSSQIRTGRRSSSPSATRADAASTWPRTRATSTPRCAGA